MIADVLSESIIFWKVPSDFTELYVLISIGVVIPDFDGRIECKSISMVVPEDIS